MQIYFNSTFLAIWLTDLLILDDVILVLGAFGPRQLLIIPQALTTFDVIIDVFV